MTVLSQCGTIAACRSAQSPLAWIFNCGLILTSITVFSWCGTIAACRSAQSPLACM